MTRVDNPEGLRNIGEEAAPPYAVLPNPLSLFLNRSKRLRTLASGHVLESYLNFVGDLTQAQHDIQADLPDAVLPDPEKIQQAFEHEMPPLARAAFDPDETMEVTFKLYLESLSASVMPDEAVASIRALSDAPRERRRQLLLGALKNAPHGDIAEYSLTLAALQVHFARLAAKLAAHEIQPIADGVCPVCGSPPMTSSVVGWPKAHNTRFCACSLCGTMWNVVRIKCVLCSSTEGISYQVIEGQPETIKAETCDKCHRYVKILYQVKDNLLDPMSDDIASLGLDILIAEEGWTCGGENPFLLGY